MAGSGRNGSGHVRVTGQSGRRPGLWCRRPQGHCPEEAQRVHHTDPLPEEPGSEAQRPGGPESHQAVRALDSEATRSERRPRAWRNPGKGTTGWEQGAHRYLMDYTAQVSTRTVPTGIGTPSSASWGGEGGKPPPGGQAGGGQAGRQAHLQYPACPLPGPGREARTAGRSQNHALRSPAPHTRCPSTSSVESHCEASPGWSYGHEPSTGGTWHAPLGTRSEKHSASSQVWETHRTLDFTPFQNPSKPRRFQAAGAGMVSITRPPLHSVRPRSGM